MATPRKPRAPKDPSAPKAPKVPEESPPTDAQLRAAAAAASVGLSDRELRGRIKRMTRNFYDIQRLRMAAGGRNKKKAAHAKIQLLPADLAILSARAQQLYAAELEALKDIGMYLQSIPFYRTTLSDKTRFKGLGPTLAAVILGEFDIERENTPSAMWRFAGYSVIPAMRCRSCHTVVNEKNGTHIHPVSQRNYKRGMDPAAPMEVPVKCQMKGKELSLGGSREIVPDFFIINHVTAITNVWVFANAGFTEADVGKKFIVAGKELANAGTWTIASVLDNMTVTSVEDALSNELFHGDDVRAWIESPNDMYESGKQERPVKNEPLHYNSWLRSKMYVLGTNLLKAVAYQCPECGMQVKTKKDKKAEKLSDELSDELNEAFAEEAENEAEADELGPEEMPKEGKFYVHKVVKHGHSCSFSGCLLHEDEIVKIPSPYRHFYDEFKYRKETQGWGMSGGHRHMAAQRYMVKMLLLDIWKDWRAHLGLAVRPSYHEEKQGGHGFRAHQVDAGAEYADVS